MMLMVTTMMNRWSWIHCVLCINYTVLVYRSVTRGVFRHRDGNELSETHISEPVSQLQRERPARCTGPYHGRADHSDTGRRTASVESSPSSPSSSSSPLEGVGSGSLLSSAADDRWSRLGRIVSGPSARHSADRVLAKATQNRPPPASTPAAQRQVWNLLP